jgi:hypothetical protein
MLARPFLIGVMALATLPHSSRQLVELIGEKTLLRVNQPSDDVAVLSVVEKGTASGVPERLVVRIDRTRSDDTTPLWQVSIQVWLLRTNGTALTRTGTQLGVMSADVGVGSLEEAQRLRGTVHGTERMEFSFPLVPPKELAGVVVSVNGKLFVREIKANPTP